MRVVLISLLLTGSAQLACAQVPSSAAPATVMGNTGKVAGAVLNAVGKPIPFATIALLNAATGKPVDGAVCDDAGKFALAHLAAGSYTLQVSFIGYQTLELAGLLVTEKSNVLNVGPLTLQAAPAQLSEVVVQGQKALVEEKVDRTVYNAEQDHTTQGGDATDVLRRVPLLSVDLDGNVSLRGSTNIKVLINNKPSTITAGSIAEALKQISADQIKAVEVITAPSAKYDAEGSGGIINIITKKDNLAGKTLDVRLSSGLRTSTLNLNGGYRVGEMGFSLGGGLRGEYNTPGTFANTQLTTSPATGKQALTTQQSATNHQQLTGRYTFGWDYDLNAHNALAMNAQLSLFNYDWQQDGLLTQTTQSNVVQSTSLRDVRQLTKRNTLDVGLTYTHLFEQPRHEFSLLTLYSRTNGTDNFTNTLLDAGSQTVTGRLRNDNDSYNQEATVQADYQRPLGDKQLLELGGKDIMRRVRSDYAYLAANGTSTEYVPLANASLSNVFTYHQNVAASYLSYTLSLPHDYSLKAGARYEHTTITADFQTGETASLPTYDVLVPSLNLSRKLASGNVLKAAFTRRIQRPSLQYLNPNLQAANPLSVSQGNPFLSPEYTNNYELAYGTSLKAMALNFSGFVRTTTGSIQNLSSVRGDTVRTTYANIGRENAYGGNLFFNVNLNQKLTLNGSTDLYYSVLTNNAADPIYRADSRGWVVNGRLSGSYKVSQQWEVQLFGFLHGREVLLQGYQGSLGTYSLSLRRTFWEQKASVSFGADNFFSPTYRVPVSLSSPVLTQYTLETRHMLAFRASFGYRIGKLSVARPKKQVDNDDLKGGGSGN